MSLYFTILSEKHERHGTLSAFNKEEKNSIPATVWYSRKTCYFPKLTYMKKKYIYILTNPKSKNNILKNIHSFWSLLIISSVINLCFRSKNLIANYQNSWESSFSQYFLIICLKIHWFLKATICYIFANFFLSVKRKLSMSL